MPIGTIQLAGSANAGPAEVELNTLAARFVARPDDFATLGAYQCSVTFSIVLGTPWSPNPPVNAPVFAVQWTSPGILGLVKKLTCSVAQSGSTTAGLVTVQLFKANGYTKQYDTYRADTSGAPSAEFIQIASNVLLNAGNKLRSSMPASQIAGLQEVDLQQGASSVATMLAGTSIPGANIVTVLSGYNSAEVTMPAGLTGGTLTLDANPVGAVSGSQPGTSGSVPVPPGSILWDARAAEYPLLLDYLTGVVAEISLPGTAGTFQVTFNMSWEELALYS
jgi:hypothetical protein